jgi:single-strand DNA-binding protein
MKVATLLGTVGSKPEIKLSSNSTTYSNFSLAVDDKDRDGEEVTEWYEIVAFGKLAKTLAHVESGDKMLVHGSFHQKSYTGRGGVQYHEIEIKAWTIELLPRKSRT